MRPAALEGFAVIQAQFIIYGGVIQGQPDGDKHKIPGIGLYAVNIDGEGGHIRADDAAGCPILLKGQIADAAFSIALVGGVAVEIPLRVEHRAAYSLAMGCSTWG